MRYSSSMNKMPIDSRGLGASSEAMLDILHAHYRTHDKAHIDHHGTRAEMKGGQWVAESSLPDYGGWAKLADSRPIPVRFDNKITTQPVYRHPKAKLHQTDDLWHYQNGSGGALAFLLITINANTDDERGWLAWPQNHWRLEAFKGFTIHLDKDTPAEIAIPVPGWFQVAPGYVPDWLAALRAMR